MKKLPAFFLSQLLLTFTIHSSPTIIYVTDNDGGNSGSLNTALQNIVDDTIIDCSPIAGQTIFLSSPLPAIGKTPITQTPIVNILGYGVTIDGSNSGDPLPVFALGQGSATISDFIIQNAGSRGGPGGSAFTGGGGGTGGGGALYVHSGTVMTVSAMALNNNQAIGGAGGDGTTATGTSGGGGGGFGGGRGGSSSATHGAGGGGGGNAGGANGATTGNHAGSNNSFHNYGGAGGGGSGVPPPDNGGSGGTNAANPATTGGMGGVGTGSEGGGGGGGGGCVGSGSGGSEAPNSVGGAGGLGCGPNSDYGVGGAGGGYGDGGGGGASSGASGGGGGYLGNGGGGGILGGGGGAGGETGGAGGFGAGGGGGSSGGNSSYLGGAGGSGSGLPAGGGGGSGLGGAIYIQTGALLIIQDGTSFSGNSTAYGMGGTAASGGTGGGNGSSLGQDIFIQSGGSLNLQINGTLTLLNPICGAGPSASSPGLITTGTGTVGLNGSNTYLGGTSIQSGTLNLNGSVVGDLSIASAGTLSGNATVIGNITSGGTISPGNSIGTVNTANLIQNSTSVYDVEINASGSSDLIIASGFAQVAGGVVVIPDSVSTAPVTYTIIATGTGVSGTFSSLTSTIPALMKLTYNPLTVQLTYLPLDPILTGNALRAAKCYGTVPLGSDTAAVNTALIGLSFDEIQTAFEQMGPAQFSGITQVQLLDAILVRSSYTKHMQELWFNKNPCCGRSFVLWSDVAGQWQHQKKSNNCFGYNDTTVGATIGADYCIHKWVLGSAFSYTHDNFNWKQSAGNANINSYYGGFYGRWNDGGFYVNAALLGAYNKYRTTRHLHFGTIDRHARSNHSGYEWLINCGFGYQVCSSKFQWTPYINLDYVQLHENGYTEAGAKSLDLHVNTKNTTLFQGEGGVVLSTAHCACKGVFVPALKLAYINQTPLSNKNYSANFVDSSCTFSGKGRNFERNLFAPRLTLHYQPSRCGVVASIYYGAEVGSSYWAQDVGFTLAIRF